MSAGARGDDVRGLDRFEWPVGHETVGRAFDELGPLCKRALLQAWSVTRWTAADRLAVASLLHQVPEPVRELVARAMLERFHPDPPPGAREFVSLVDFEPTRFLAAFERVRAEVAPPPTAPSTASAAPPPPPPCPEPRTPAEERRRAAVAYFGGRTRPFALEELAEFLGVSPQTLLQLRRGARTKAFVRGKIVRIPVEEAYALIAHYTV